MKRLKKIGKIIPKHSQNVASSRIGIGLEKLDRDIFDPTNVYDHVAELGVKWVRIQSGWQKTEREKGVYSFAWLDCIVDNLIDRGLIPWMCLCYGNELYDEEAKKQFGAVGCPPVVADEQKQAWADYVRAVVTHYKGKIDYFEIWNEPDSPFCWKRGINPTEYGEFARDTGKVIKEANGEAKVIGGALSIRPLWFIHEALSAGMSQYMDFISFHGYNCDESDIFERVEALRALVKHHNPQLDVIQGESGSPSKTIGYGPMLEGFWTPEKQAKQLARHTMADLITNVHFMSYFSCMDMIEGLDTRADQAGKVLDYAYLGVIEANMDENGYPTGTYTPKPSYFVLQNIASVFAGEMENVSLPTQFYARYSPGIFDMGLMRSDISCGGFRREGGEAFVYWHPTSIMTSSYEGTTSLEVLSVYDRVRLIDVMDGSIYEIPEEIVSRGASGVFDFKDLPIKDTPLILEFGNFVKE